MLHASVNQQIKYTVLISVLYFNKLVTVPYLRYLIPQYFNIFVHKSSVTHVDLGTFPGMQLNFYAIHRDRDHNVHKNIGSVAKENWNGRSKAHVSLRRKEETV